MHFSVDTFIEHMGASGYTLSKYIYSMFFFKSNQIISILFISSQKSQSHFVIGLYSLYS